MICYAYSFFQNIRAKCKQTNANFMLWIIERYEKIQTRTEFQISMRMTWRFQRWTEQTNERIESNELDFMLF